MGPRVTKAHIEGHYPGPGGASHWRQSKNP